MTGLFQYMEEALAYVKEELGPSAWHSMELTMATTGELEVVHHVGVGEKQHARNQYGQGASPVTAVEDAKLTLFPRNKKAVKPAAPKPPPPEAL